MKWGIGRCIDILLSAWLILRSPVMILIVRIEILVMCNVIELYGSQASLMSRSVSGNGMCFHCACWFYYDFQCRTVHLLSSPCLGYRMQLAILFPIVRINFCRVTKCRDCKPPRAQALELDKCHKEVVFDFTLVIGRV